MEDRYFYQSIDPKKRMKKFVVSLKSVTKLSSWNSGDIRGIFLSTRDVSSISFRTLLVLDNLLVIISYNSFEIRKELKGSWRTENILLGFAKF